MIDHHNIRVYQTDHYTIKIHWSDSHMTYYFPVYHFIRNRSLLACVRLK